MGAWPTAVTWNIDRLCDGVLDAFEDVVALVRHVVLPADFGEKKALEEPLDLSHTMRYVLTCPGWTGELETAPQAAARGGDDTVCRRGRFVARGRGCSGTTTKQVASRRHGRLRRLRRRVAPGPALRQRNAAVMHGRLEAREAAQHRVSLLGIKIGPRVQGGEAFIVHDGCLQA